jgi:hypothetical protein
LMIDWAPAFREMLISTNDSNFFMFFYLGEELMMFLI